MALLHLALFLRLYPSKSHVQLLEKAQLQFIHKERAVLRRSARLPWAVILALTPPRTRAGAYFLISAYSSAMLGTRARIGSLPVVVPTAYARARDLPDDDSRAVPWSRPEDPSEPSGCDGGVLISGG